MLARLIIGNDPQIHSPKFTAPCFTILHKPVKGPIGLFTDCPIRLNLPIYPGVYTFTRLHGLHAKRRARLARNASFTIMYHSSSSLVILLLLPCFLFPQLFILLHCHIIHLNL